MKVEDDCRVTVGRAGGATAGGGGGGGACGAGFLQAAPRATTTSKVLNRALVYVRVRIVLLPPLAIYRSMCTECTSDLKPLENRCSKSAQTPTSNLLRRPVGRLILPLLGQLSSGGAIREHGPDLPRPGAGGFENKMAP